MNKDKEETKLMVSIPLDQYNMLLGIAENFKTLIERHTEIITNHKAEYIRMLEAKVYGPLEHRRRD